MTTPDRAPSDPGRRTLLHGPLFSRRTPLRPDNAASRISAYIYGNILVLTALVPVVTAHKHVGILVVLATAASTFVAHSFAETVGDSVRRQRAATRSDRIRGLRDSVRSSRRRYCPARSSRLDGWGGSNPGPRKFSPRSSS